MYMTVSFYQQVIK